MTPQWYRVEFGPGGQVESIQLVEVAAGNSTTVIYVLADSDSADAVKAKAQRARAKLAQQMRRAQYEAIGKCRCGRDLDGDGPRCDTCRARWARDNERRRAKQRGETPEPLPPKSEAWRERNAEKEVQVRLATLLEVRSAWARLASRREFTEWLRVKIAELGHEDRRCA